jgi:hypothetical protein
MACLGEAFSQIKSPKDVPMDVNDDNQDEAVLKLNEDELRELQKVSSIQCIEGMRILPKEESRFDISLYRMVYMLLVHPTLAHDIKRLEVEIILCSRFPSATSTERSGLSKMRMYQTGAPTGPQSTRNLKPSWLQTLTLSSSMVVCFLFAMETTDSRHG